MAEEEVDWGMDESVDVDEWRRGAVEEAVEVGDEDVISLDGAEDGEDAGKIAKARFASPRKSMSGKSAPTGPSKAPPTGPRRAIIRPGGPNGAPTGPRPASVDPPKAEEETPTPVPADTTVKAPQTPPAPPKEETPLPEGWVKFDSAQYKRPFYYHKETKTTVWERPIAPVLQDRPDSPPAPPVQEKAESPKPELPVKVDEPEVETTEKKVPTGPAGSDPVATAYAARRTKAADVPKGPAKWLDGPDSYRPRRDRSSSPSGEPAKRFKRDDGGQSPPLSARLAAMDRTYFRLALSRTAGSPPRRMLALRTRSPPRPGPPHAPRSFPNDRTRSPPRQRPIDPHRASEFPRRPFEAPDVRRSTKTVAPADAFQSRMPRRSPPRPPFDPSPRVAMGANTAPLTQSWWGAKGGSDSVAVGAPPIPAAGLSSRVTSVSDTSRTDDPALARARLQADRAEMEEKLKRLKEEEDNLARKEAENKQREEETKRRDADQRRKNDELERQRADRDNARRRELDSRPPQSMYPPRPPHDRPMPPDLPPRDGPMRPGLSTNVSSNGYRPISPPPGLRPPLSSRFGDGPPRPRDGPPFGRRPLPPRRMLPESPPRLGRPHPPLGRSPPSRNGDSYQPGPPGPNDRHPSRDLVERMDRGMPPRSLMDRMDRDRLPPGDMMGRGPPPRDVMSRGPPPSGFNDRGPPPRDLNDRGPSPRMPMDRGLPSRDAMDRGPPPRDMMDRGPPMRDAMERRPPPRDMMDRVPTRDLVERIRPREFAEPMSAFAVGSPRSSSGVQADQAAKQRSRPRSPPGPMSRQSSGRSERPSAERMLVEQDRPPRDDRRSMEERRRRT